MTESGTPCDFCGRPRVAGCQSGFVMGEAGARQCDQRRFHYVDELIEDATIPGRFRRASVGGFDVSGHAKLRAARDMVRRYVEEFAPADAEDPTPWGLLLTGEPGGGKTHLAAAALQELIRRHALRGAFRDFTRLAAEIQATFDTSTSKASVIDPVISADILVLDELGAAKPSEWVLDTLYLIVNSRYSEASPTIFTTNYLVSPPTARSGDRQIGRQRANTGYSEPLSARIGERLVSRLFEMAAPVDMVGVGDYRRKSPPGFT